MRSILVLSALIAVVSLPLVSPAASTPSVDTHLSCPPLLQHRFAPLRGGESESLCRHAGKVLLVVNTASYCGYTAQYQGLQALHDRYRDKGLIVVGFPANDFGKQEPGSAAEIADFCERTFKVQFPMMEKTSVVEGGDNRLYAALAKLTGQRPKWNFHKYLVARDGNSVLSFDSRTEPLAPELVAAIERMLVIDKKK